MNRGLDALDQTEATAQRRRDAAALRQPVEVGDVAAAGGQLAHERVGRGRRLARGEQEVGEDGQAAAHEARDAQAGAAPDHQRERADQPGLAPGDVHGQLGAVAVVAPTTPRATRAA